MLAKSIIALVLATAVGIALLNLTDEGALADILRVLAFVLIIAALGWLGVTWIKWVSTNLVVTTDRCIYRSGIVAKRGIEIPLERINTIFFEQGILDRMVGAGSLVIESAGEMGRQQFEDVKDPVNVQNVLYQEMEDNENRKFDRLRSDAPVSTADELSKLVDLRNQGHLSESEFEAQKARLLGHG
jgi:uncharacterized membrane protein YdbT with pleckstrin-like domain